MLGNGFRHVNPNEEVARKVELVTEVNPFQYPQFDKRVTEAWEKAAERVFGNALIFYIMITDVTQKTFDDNSTGQNSGDSPVRFQENLGHHPWWFRRP